MSSRAVECPSCGERQAIDDASSGRRSRCRKCQAPLPEMRDSRASTLATTTTSMAGAAATAAARIESTATAVITPGSHSVDQRPASRESTARESQSRESLARESSVRDGAPASGTLPTADTPHRPPGDGSVDSENIVAIEPTIGRVGRFELRSALGQGAYGRVYRAYDPLLDRMVALKMPRSGLDQPRRIARFVREAKAAARLRHPNIVAVFESGKAGNDYFIVSEFVQGDPLSVRMAESRPDFQTAVLWVHAIAEGLAYAHSEGVIHRDIKPSNIMLGPGDRPQMMDFGMAKRVDEDATVTTEGSLLGTPAYMSPEQAKGDSKAVGAASDQYSLGVVLYELLTAVKPFDGPPHVVIGRVAGQELPPAPRLLNPSIPKDLEAICLKALAKEPARRYPHMREFAADLERWLKGEQVQARPPGTLERLQRWYRRYPMLALATAISILSLSIAAGLSISFALYEARIAKELRTAVDEANTERERAEEALERARIQSKRANELLGQVQEEQTQTQRERDRTAEALGESERQRERAEVALKEAETQRIRAEQVLAELGSSKAKAAEERVRLLRLQTETYLDRGLRQCSQGDVVQGMLWLSEAYVLGSESADTAELARVARENLSAWKGHIARAKRQRSGEVVVDVSPDGQQVQKAVIRPVDLRPDSSKWEVILNYAEPALVHFSADARTALLIDKQGKVIQPYYLGPAQPTPAPQFEKARAWRSNGRAVAVLSGNGLRTLMQEDLETASVWDTRARTTPKRPLIELGGRRIQALALSQDGKLAACVAARGQNNSSVLILSTDTAQLLGERDIPPLSIGLLAFSADDRFLLANNQRIDLRTLSPIGKPLPFAELMKSAAYSPDGQVLMTCSTRTLWLWDGTGGLLREIPSLREPEHVAFEPSGQYALTWGKQHAQVWDVRTGRAVGPAYEPTSSTTPVQCAVLDGETLLLAGNKEMYRIRRKPLPLPGPASRIRTWVQVLTEAELTSDNAVRVLEGEGWSQRLEELRQAKG